MRHLLCFLPLLVLAACSSKPLLGPDIPEDLSSFIEGATDLEALTLDPAVQEGLGNLPEGEESFHGYRILGRTTLPKGHLRERILVQLRAGIAADPGMVAGCFNPRHALRAVQGDDWCDVLICFECFSVKVRASGERSHSTRINGSYGPGMSVRYGELGLPIAD